MKRPWYMSDISGAVDILGEPLLDTKRQVLSFTHLDYTLQSRSTLLNVAAYLLKPIVLGYVQQNASVDLSQPLQMARAAANTQVKQLASGIGADSTLSLEKIQVESIAISGTTLVAVVSGQGATKVQLASK